MKPNSPSVQISIRRLLWNIIIKEPLYLMPGESCEWRELINRNLSVFTGIAVLSDGFPKKRSEPICILQEIPCILIHSNAPLFTRG